MKIDSISELQELFNKFGDKDGLIELVIRDKKSKYKSFTKLMMNNSTKSEQAKESYKKMMKAINKSNAINEKSLKKLSSISKLNSLTLALEGLNLCATVAGFVIMYNKLEKMSKQVNEVLNAVKKSMDIHANYEFNKILSIHSDMLDRRKTRRYYSEEQLRQLVDDEYNVLKLLLDVFDKNVSYDTESLLFCICSMSSMLAVSIKYFNEEYYYNTKDVQSEDFMWHSSHDNWLKIYERLTSKKFKEILQDAAIFDMDVSVNDANNYALATTTSFKEAIQSIKDNQYLLTHLDNKEELMEVRTLTDKELFDEIETILKDNKLDEDVEFDKQVKAAFKKIRTAI